MKKRNLLPIFLLSIVTLGIYCIYWLYSTRKELIARNGKPDSVPPVIVLFLPLFFVFTAIVLLAMADIATGETNAGFGIAAMLVGLVGVAAVLGVPLWWFYKYCRAVVEVAKGMEFGPLYVLYVAISWFCGFMPAWMLIVQSDLNKVAHQPPHPPHPTPGHPGAPHHQPPHHPPQQGITTPQVR